MAVIGALAPTALFSGPPERNGEPAVHTGADGATDPAAEDELTTLTERLDALETELATLRAAAKPDRAEDATQPSVQARGRIHTDANWFHQGAANRAAVGDLQDGTYFRRARLGFDADAFEITEYRLDFEMGSGGGRPSLFDAYGRVTNLPLLGNLQLGHFREPFSLEAQTSSNWYTFLERALNNTFDPSRNWGLMAFDHNAAETVTWAVGVFRTGSDEFGDDVGDSGERAVTGRVTWLPFYDQPSQGRSFLATGFSYSYRDPDKQFLPAPGDPEEAIVEYEGRPLNNLNEDDVWEMPSFISVNFPDANDVQLIGWEASWNLGSLNVQSEFIGSLVDRAGAPDAFLHGSYVQASYFLTGESRQWNRRLGTFDQAEVFEPFFRVRTAKQGIQTGSGAWEVALRWSDLNLNDASAGIRGGYLDALTVGLNWYLHAYMRIMFNYSHVDLHDPVDGRSDAQVFHTRLDVHF